MKDWVHEIGQRQACAQEVADTVEGKKFLTWLRESVCLADETTIGLPAEVVQYREGMRYVWIMVQRELGKSTAEVLYQARQMERQQERNDELRREEYQ